MEIKIIFRDGISEKKFLEIEKSGLGDLYYFGRYDRKKSVAASCVLRGRKKELDKKWKILSKILFSE